MNDREKFAKDFIERGATRGYSRDQIGSALKQALSEYDSSHTRQGKTGGSNILGQIAEFLAPRTTEFVTGMPDKIQNNQMPAQRGMQQITGDTPLERLKQVPGAMWTAGVESFKQFVPPAAEMAAYLTAGAKPKGEGALQKIIASGKTGATIGGTLGATNPENQDLTSTLESAGMGALTGATIAGGLTLAGITAGKVKDFIFGEGTRLAAGNQLVGQSRGDVRLNKEGQNWLSDKVTEKLKSGELKPGGYKELHDQAWNLQRQREDVLQGLVKEKGNVTMTELFKPVDDLIEQARKAGNTSKAESLEAFKKTIRTEWGNRLSKTRALDFKRTMDGELADTMFKKSADEISSTLASAQRALGDAARKWIKGSDERIGALLDDQSVYIQLAKSMENQMKAAGTAPIKGGSVGGLSIWNLLGKLVTAPATNPKVISGGMATAGKTSSFLSKMDALKRAGERAALVGVTSK